MAKYKVIAPITIDGKVRNVGEEVELRPSQGIVKLGQRFKQIEPVNPNAPVETNPSSGAPREPAHTEPVPPGAAPQGGSRPPGEIEAEDQRRRDKAAGGGAKARADFNTRFKPNPARKAGEPLTGPGNSGFTKEQIESEEKAASEMDERQSQNIIPQGVRDGGVSGNETRVDGTTGLPVSIGPK